ncbi:MAG: iron chelate uptake ABC transporter family permease subunit [Planctomycetes bacterium]|nr:iron chelate uptake ABC transporter family permease subunit [Planctomycetota bacterium]
MIHDFCQSWDLFANTYIAGWLIAVLLAMVGVMVVARDQIFIGAAVAQASTLGIALAMIGATWFGHGVDDAAFAPLAAVVFAVGAAVLTARPGQIGRESHEAVTGWVFLGASAGAILLVTHSPHGLDEVQRLLASSIIGASLADVAVFAALAIVTVVIITLAHRTLRLLVMDEQTAAVLGVRVRLWNFAIAIWLGLTLGLSLRTSGMLYAFGCLVLPALAAKSLCRRVAPMFVVAPLVALIAAVMAFVLANHYDLPPAQTDVGLMAGLMLPAWGVRRLRG